MKTNLIFIILLMSKTLFAEEKDNVKYVACGNSPKAIELARLLIETNSQQIKTLHCNKTLTKTALLKAEMMARADRIDHNLNNTTPNELLRKAGVELPGDYDFLGNQVESISGGAKLPIEAFTQFMNSPAHKRHLMGEGAMGLEQGQIGVGYYQDKHMSHEDYWVVYVTALRTKDDKNNKMPVIKYSFIFDNTALQNIKKLR